MTHWRRHILLQPSAYTCTHIHTQMHTCTHVHSSTFTHSHACTHMHPHSHAHMHTCTHIHTHIHTCTHMHTHTFTHAHSHIHTLTCKHTCAHSIHSWACMHLYTYISGNVSLYYTGDTLFCFSILFFYCGPHPIIKFTNPECRGWWGVFRTNFLRTNSLRYDLYGTKFTPLKFTTHFLVYFQNSQQSSNLL
jgi:hypothetical protein